MLKTTIFIIIAYILLLLPGTLQSEELLVDTLAEVTVLSKEPIRNSDLNWPMRVLCQRVDKIYPYEDEILLFCENGIVSFDLVSHKLDSIFACSFSEFSDSVAASIYSSPFYFKYSQNIKDTFSMSQQYRTTNKFNYLISFDRARTWDTLYHNGNIEFLNMYDKNNLIYFQKSKKKCDKTRFQLSYI